MESGAVRRTVVVLLGYAVVGWVVFLLGGWLRRVLALPPLFDDLLTWSVYGGAAVAALMAWHYPTIAADQGRGGVDGDVRGDRPPR